MVMVTARLHTASSVRDSERSRAIFDLVRGRGRGRGRSGGRDRGRGRG